MKRYAKTLPAVLVSAVILTACGDSEEEDEGNNGENGTTEIENDSSMNN